MSLIDDFCEVTKGMPVPDSFKVWSAISIIGGMLERRVWTDVGVRPIYPNMFVLLVAPPGTGKSIPINLVSRIWRETSEGTLHVAPNNLTKPAFLDAIEKSTRQYTNPYTGELEIYHSLLVASPEFGNFMPAHDTDFLNVLNTMYDAEDSYGEARRASKDVKIAKPVVTIIGGTQPDYLASLLPEEAWGMGFTSRLVMIYSGERTKVSLTRNKTQSSDAVSSYAKKLAPILKLDGMAEWTDEAWEALNHWYIEEDEEPKPTHPRLRHYCTRRMITLCKLSTIVAVAETMELKIRAEHFAKARQILEEAELYMPDIFKDMAGHSENDIILDLHYWMHTRYSKSGEPIPKSELYRMIQRRVPVHKSEFIYQMLQNSRLIKVTGKGIIPQELREFGE